MNYNELNHDGLDQNELNHDGLNHDELDHNEKCDCCETIEVHPDLLKIVNEKMPDETELYDLAELFKVFGDSTRIRILFVLFEAEVCVCDLAQALNMTQSAISHQLKILRQNKLVKSRREGKSIFYSLADEHVRTIIAQGCEHIEEEL
ncbi:MAG: helix-turn-helix transcriptional regulator [Lachnospiraceae bacterium]|nr:helix-turn-helix transcriptional regulator [Lachnospiraceae bacterium]